MIILHALFSFLIADCEPEDTTRWLFVGCAYDFGECFMSCEDQNAKKRAEENPKLCTDDRLPFACFCEIRYYDNKSRN